MMIAMMIMMGFDVEIFFGLTRGNDSTTVVVVAWRKHVFVPTYRKYFSCTDVKQEKKGCSTFSSAPRPSCVSSSMIMYRSAIFQVHNIICACFVPCRCSQVQCEVTAVRDTCVPERRNLEGRGIVWFGESSGPIDLDACP
ncbi:hypothetical protein NEUTE1DRAFT_101744 [Neurospora tetrasperma FGSC 2508]|uniref:Uncharacterized protein n=1 Tax=Neurospora tetrasperma (strain FGSC 2508 / ATCC MYA-4615 / P0657) TaxID=510951 RepID=F8MQ34_NEUT8|nr:uncharacterized protein NEUTE1DRAFT_101744 [Neurospora tetrasperma FGSC 2508]EGO56464.1 hypothetical protein NEUTE1DRAFT_101744 [Neurospora tetrasperma FGSC 2508]EGZ70670.1 hypothetical protein NEUTE2DRAFT_68389 [Neurospora tetrasperma FGSC 2509]